MVMIILKVGLLLQELPLVDVIVSLRSVTGWACNELAMVVK